MRDRAPQPLPTGYRMRERMHELSIAMGIVNAALDESRRRDVQVSAVHLRLGALSGVLKDALLFSYEVACLDTPLQGSQLIVEDVPVIVFCQLPKGAGVTLSAAFCVSGMWRADDGRASRQGT
jgi:Zn finger protein HypA/HybF involved in hydrogenase expression